MKQLWQNLAAPALALVLAGATLGIPAAAARHEERALLDNARPRPALGGILWQEPVRQNPVLYALHRTALQGSMPGYAAAEPAAVAAEPAAVAAEAAALLDTLHEAGVVGEELTAELAPLLEAVSEAGVVDVELPAELAPLLAAPANAWRSAGGRFTSLRLTMPGNDSNPNASLDLTWHTESGLPVAFTANVPGASFDNLDLRAMAQACRTMLGLDALGDWVESDEAGRSLVCTSAAGQVRLTVSTGGGYVSFALTAEA